MLCRTSMPPHAHGPSCVVGVFQQRPPNLVVVNGSKVERDLLLGSGINDEEKNAGQTENHVTLEVSGDVRVSMTLTHVAAKCGAPMWRTMRGPAGLRD